MIDSQSLRTERINSAYRFILDNFEEHFTLQDIADSVGCSKYHLNREFAEFTGLNLGEFVQRRRLSRAEKLLREKHFSVIDVAQQVGYESHSSFTRAFRKMFGYSPVQAQYNLTTNNTKSSSVNVSISPSALIASVIKRDAVQLLGQWGEGFYEQSFAHIAKPLFGQVMQAIYQTGTQEVLPLLGISTENPLNIPEQQARFFAGTSVSPSSTVNVIGTGSLTQEIWPAGYYLHCEQVGALNTLWQTISQLYIQYIYPEHVAAPNFQIFYHFHTNDNRDIIKTDIYIPLEK